jgi:hypothetical protein
MNTDTQLAQTLGHDGSKPPREFWLGFWAGASLALAAGLLIWMVAQ